MKNSTEEIRDIFYSGSHSFRGDLEPIKDIVLLIDKGYLLLTKVLIGTKGKHSSLLHNYKHLPDKYDAAGGSSEHIVLKILSKEYMEKECGCKNVTFEESFHGYYPDVLDKEKLIITECGHTQNPEKILQYFLQGNITKCIQVPYPDPEDQNVYGFAFTASGTLIPFLEFSNKEKSKDIKRMICDKK